MDSKGPITPIERKVLHKERVFTGTHNYFFEVKEASNSSKYLVIDQRRKVGDNYESAKMRIFEDELLEFQRILQKMIRLTRGASRRIKVINDIAVKEVAISDLLDLYPERLKGGLNDEHLEVKLRNI
jgi:hypothetical protein